MGTTRAETIILFLLEFVGLACAVYGLWFQYVINLSLTGILYCSLWYVLSFASHLLGLISIIMEQWETDEMKAESQELLQHHFLTSWLGVVVGYPLMVTYTWMQLYPTLLAQAHLLFAVIPVLTLIGQSYYGIVRTTQVCTILTSVSHLTLCYLAGDFWGVSSAIAMWFNVLALSTPTKYHIWAFNSREVFVVGLVITSILMNNSILNMARGITITVKLGWDAGLQYFWWSVDTTTATERNKIFCICIFYIQMTFSLLISRIIITPNMP